MRCVCVETAGNASGFREGSAVADVGLVDSAGLELGGAVAEITLGGCGEVDRALGDFGLDVLAWVGEDGEGDG